MVISRTQQPAISITTNGQKLEEVDSFEYLVSKLTMEGSSTQAVKTKLNLAASAINTLNVI